MTVVVVDTYVVVVGSFVLDCCSVDALCVVVVELVLIAVGKKDTTSE